MVLVVGAAAAAVAAAVAAIAAARLWMYFCHPYSVYDFSENIILDYTRWATNVCLRDRESVT